MPFVATVSLNAAGQPIYLKLDLVNRSISQAIAKRAKARLLSGAIVTSDGLGYFAAVTEARCVHAPKVVGAVKARDLPEFKWVNTVLGNLKSTLACALRAPKYRK